MTCFNAEGDLNVVNDYFGSNSLSLSVNKTKVIHFSSPGRAVLPASGVTLNGTPIDTVAKFKYLSLIFNPCLKWDNHIVQLAAKIKWTVRYQKSVANMD